MPQAVARAVERSCVDAPRPQPKLLHAVFSLLNLQMLEKNMISRFRFWEPEEVPNPRHAHAASICARDCAQLRGCIAVAAQVAAHIVSFAICKCFKNSHVQVPILGTPKGLKFLQRACLDQLRARLRTAVWMRRCWQPKIATRIVVTLDFANARKT